MRVTTNKYEIAVIPADGLPKQKKIGQNWRQVTINCGFSETTGSLLSPLLGLMRGLTISGFLLVLCPSNN